MLTLNDGRNELWQWDTGRKLTVDADCSQVHFSNKFFGRSLGVDVVDGVAIIPDVLLQTDKDLNAWAFVGTPENGYTKISKIFKVNKRNKPADYVFTPPEQTTLGEIMERLDKIEESQDPDAIKNAVEGYIADNPVQIEEKDPTVPDWAKRPQKPTYTAEEVGAQPKGDCVLYAEQNLTEAQKAQARENIGAVGADEIDITNQKLTAIKSNIDGIETTLQESGVSGAIQYQFTTLEDSDADVDVELTADELVELNTTVASLQSLKKSNTAIVAFLTDLHITNWNTNPVKIKKAVAGYNKVSSSVKTDLLLLGGDYLDNNPNTTKETALDWYSDLRSILAYCNDKVPAAVIKGNHDDNTMHTDYINGLVDFEAFWDALGNIDDDRTVRNGGNIDDCYGYYDIPNQKIRVFYLNTVDIPQVLNKATNTINYKAQWDTGFSNEQLQFVADHLKFDSPGWQVMVFSHHPIMRDISIESGCGVAANRGGSALLELLYKFNTTSNAGSISVTATDFKGTVTYDFTGNKDCKLIACVNGHTHRDSVDIYNDSFFCISTRAVSGHASYSDHISSSAYFVVDRNNKKLHLIYNGDGEDNAFNYASLTEGEETPTEPVYEEIASPFDWQIGVRNETTGALESDSAEMRISSTEVIGFTTPTTIDMSAFPYSNSFYIPYWFDTDGNYIENGGEWISTSVVLEIPVDRTIALKIRHNGYAVWTEDSISAFDAAVKVYVEEGGSSYIVGGSETPSEPDTPEKTLTSISAVYSGGSVPVGTAVNDLTGIVVTARYSDDTSESVTGYTLSGTIAEGNNTITVSYGGKTTTFTVTGFVETGMVEIENPFTFTIHTVDETTGELVLEDSKMRIASQIVGFTTAATIDMSAFASIDSALYAWYWYDADGVYSGENSNGWITMDTPFDVPADKAVRIKIRYENYYSWELSNKIPQLESVIKVYVEPGGSAYVIEQEKPGETTVELGKPIENALYVIGGSASTGSVGLGVYENASRMTALARNGVKPIPDINALCAEEVYFIAIPAEATKVIVTCTGFTAGLMFIKYENDGYTKLADLGWLTNNGLTYSFTAGAYSHVAINFKNSSNTTIPTDTDTSGFSIVFE